MLSKVPVVIVGAFVGLALQIDPADDQHELRIGQCFDAIGFVLPVVRQYQCVVGKAPAVKPRMDDSRAFVFELDAAEPALVEMQGEEDVVFFLWIIVRPFVVDLRVDVGRMEFSEEPFARYVFDGSGAFDILQAGVWFRKVICCRKDNQCGREQTNA